MELSHNPIFDIKRQHIKFYYHSMKERVLEEEIQLKYINTSAQMANTLTKPLKEE